jgi:hypothetical protein
MIPIPTCKCGRNYAHCYNCATKGVYVRSRESEWLSDRLKKPITSFKCKSCGFEFDTTMECTLPVKMSSFVSTRKETPEEIAKRFNDAGGSQTDVIIALTEAGYIVAPPPNKQVEESAANSKELPEGWTRDSDGKISPPETISIDEILKGNGGKK